MPEGSSVGNRVVNSAADEDAVRELGDLDGSQGSGVAGVAQGQVERKKLPEVMRNVLVRRQKDVDGEVLGFGLDEIDAGVVANDVDVSFGVGLKAAGEGGEVGEGEGEGVFERGDKVGDVEGRGAEEDAFLDVLTREHGKIRDGELEGFDCGFRDWINCAF